jgi:hypothetical protein
MNLEWLGAIFGALLFLNFCLLRRIVLYCIGGALALSAFAFLSWAQFHDRPQEWLVLSTGLALDWSGLLAVRIMLARSVSLRMLSALSAGNAPITAGEEMAGRFRDMRYFQLISRTNEGGCSLTWFGRFCSAIVASLYAILRIKT